MRLNNEHHSTFNRWLKHLVILLVIVLIVMLLIPAELTHEQLGQIKPGMTMTEVKNRLGEPNVTTETIIISPDNSGQTQYQFASIWIRSGYWSQPTAFAQLPEKAIKIESEYATSKWLGKSSLLWIEHDANNVKHVWLIPVTKQGGGFQGCLDTIKDYWNKWWK